MNETETETVTRGRLLHSSPDGDEAVGVVRLSVGVEHLHGQRPVVRFRVLWVGLAPKFLQSAPSQFCQSLQKRSILSDKFIRLAMVASIEIGGVDTVFVV